MASLIGPKSDVALAEEAAEAGSGVGVCVVANDNNAGNVVISGRQGRGRRADREGQGAGRAGHPAERLGALPLPADAARRRRDGRGAGDRDHPRAARAAGGQCHGRGRPTIPRRSAGCWSSR